ncbi:hypothetical protein BCR32DRAFT_241135 [Anaeromyces robustus]|uniref:Uncharacterized protein n=1 Tax=Anaeromyces robustus TaxID=1754192 RepID=A0A1Y1XKJ5_9FUNG|nr:hypothetical protein BCR32DRAFT_241135 [Anaeromyces robustus]|eukprot:ORX86281.1 hypothetical protein BCR32DRAFT_241135 [Anaeromyces robustus]
MSYIKKLYIDGKFSELFYYMNGMLKKEGNELKFRKFVIFGLNFFIMNAATEASITPVPKYLIKSKEINEASVAQEIQKDQESLIYPVSDNAQFILEPLTEEMFIKNLIKQAPKHEPKIIGIIEFQSNENTLWETIDGEKIKVGEINKDEDELDHLTIENENSSIRHLLISPTLIFDHVPDMNIVCSEKKRKRINPSQKAKTFKQCLNSSVCSVNNQSSSLIPKHKGFIGLNYYDHSSRIYINNYHFKLSFKNNISNAFTPESSLNEIISNVAILNNNKINNDSYSDSNFSNVDVSSNKSSNNMNGNDNLYHSNTICTVVNPPYPLTPKNINGYPSQSIVKSINSNVFPFEHSPNKFFINSIIPSNNIVMNDESNSNLSNIIIPSNNIVLNDESNSNLSNMIIPSNNIVLNDESNSNLSNMVIPSNNIVINDESNSNLSNMVIPSNNIVINDESNSNLSNMVIPSNNIVMNDESNSNLSNLIIPNNNIVMNDESNSNLSNIIIPSNNNIVMNDESNSKLSNMIIPSNNNIVMNDESNSNLSNMIIPSNNNNMNSEYYSTDLEEADNSFIEITVKCNAGQNIGLDKSNLIISSEKTYTFLGGLEDLEKASKVSGCLIFQTLINKDPDFLL